MGIDYSSHLIVWPSVAHGRRQNCQQNKGVVNVDKIISLIKEIFPQPLLYLQWQSRQSKIPY